MQSYKDGRLFKAQFNWKMPDLFGLLRSAFAATSIQRQTAAYGEQLPIPGGLLSDVYTRKRTGSFPPQAVLPLPAAGLGRKRCRRSPEADVRQPSGNTSLGWISAGPLPGDDARKRTFSARPGAKPGAQAPLHRRYSQSRDILREGSRRAEDSTVVRGPAPLCREPGEASGVLRSRSARPRADQAV